MQSLRQDEARMYIIGAGFAGRALAREFLEKEIFGDVVAFLDDDPKKIGTRIESIPVLGPIRDVIGLLNRSPADEAIIAIPNAKKEILQELYFLLKKSGFAKIRILPALAQIVEGVAHLIQTREIESQDLLGRSPVQIRLIESLGYLRGRRVLITGAGGSIGSELCRQLLSAGLSRLYLLGHGENSIYQIDRELRILQEAGIGEKTDLVPIIGELKDKEYVTFILQRLKADCIFHTAAFKHVPMTEDNPITTVHNNVLGTSYLVQAARIAKTRRFILVSTDKAVEPVSIYGASKMLAEKIVLAEASTASFGDFMVVRFGNVLGSRGSILPLLKNQIETGGPVTITHPEVRRYFMTIPEACSLVLKTGGIGKRGERYMLDMGEPVKIKYIAEQMIRFYGFEPGKEIKIVYTKLRPGERLEEKLYAEDEMLLSTEYQGIKRLEQKEPTSNFSNEKLAQMIKKLEYHCLPNPGQEMYYRNRRSLRKLLKSIIPSIITVRHEPEY